MALRMPHFRVPIPTVADVEKAFKEVHNQANRALKDLKKTSQEFTQGFNKAIQNLKKSTLASLDSAGEPANKQFALQHARDVSYAMTGKSGVQSLHRDIDDWVAEKRGDKDHKPRRVQSVLGGAFLRMYLDHEVDPDIIDQVRDEVRRSPEFKVLQDEVQQKMNIERSRFAKLETPEALGKEIARIALLKLRSKQDGPGIAFRYELNPVIGGVSEVSVGGATATTTKIQAGTTVGYRVDVTFHDTYDFDNTRTGEYDAYRKKLAQLLRQGKYGEFWKNYLREASGALGVNAEARQTRLDEAAVFASFMYALERKGWTPGPLAWQVTVPMEGSFTIPTKPAKSR